MKLVIIGGTGLIGSKLVTKLNEHGHEAVRGITRHRRQHAHRRRSRRGPRRRVGRRRRLELSVLRGDGRAWSSSTTSTRNLLEPRAAAGVGHHVALSVVGTERMPDSRLPSREDRSGNADQGVRRSRTRSCTRRSSSSSSSASPTRRLTATTVRLPPVLIQPMAADDVAKAVGSGRRGRAGEWHRRSRGPRTVPFRRADPSRPRGAQRSARGGRRPARALLRRRTRRALADSGADARLGEIRFQEWLARPVL